MSDASPVPGGERTWRVLNVEDLPGDSLLIERELRRRLGSVELVRVDTPEAFAAALAGSTWDIVIADHRLPRFSSLGALAMLRESGHDLPVVVVSGTMGVEFAVEAMRAGARDYLVKDDLVRLSAVVRREVEDATTRRQAVARHLLREEVLEALQTPGELQPVLGRVLELLRRHAGADAAAIRLRSQGDFPYAAQVGLSDRFLASEGSLCLPAAQEEVARPGSAGLELACLCGAVILQRRGRPWPLTGNGSFVTGALRQALADAGPLPQPLTGCLDDGYASLALLPLRSSQEMLGLLQLNARAADRFDGPLIQFLEEICASLGLAIERREAEEALRASEERYRVLVETSPDGVALLRADGVVLTANHRLGTLLGAGDGPSLEGRRLVELVAEEDRPRAEGLLAAFLAEGGGRSDLLRFRQGEAVIEAELAAARTASPAGEPPGLVVVVRDVTEQRRLRARLAQADRMASVGMLAAGVAHEVNNPLTYVLSNLEGLAAELAGPDASRPAVGELAARAREALDGALRIRKIVRDLRVFSSCGDERLQPVALNQAIEGAINMTHGEVKYRARLVKELGPIPPVLTNEGRLAQVFLNLLVNAAQAIPEGDAEHHQITVRTWSEPGVVLAEVRDTGAGIPAAIQSRIFEPFFTTKAAGVGTGLGLAISRGIVEEAGGQISVESHPGEGARFLVRLPAAPASAVPTPAPGARVIPPSASRRGRILIVDDEALVRSSLVRLLRGEHDVVEAAGGKAAEAILSGDAAFDVILCDLIMPEMSGMELHERLAASRPQLAERMVFMSGGAFTERAGEFIRARPTRLLEKPVDVVLLRQLVRQLVDFPAA